VDDLTDRGRAVVIFIAAMFIAIAAWYCHGQGAALASIPIRSAGSISDLRPGTQVLAYGGVWAGPQDGLVLYVNETEHCSTDDDGDRSCTWKETGRTTPQFDLVAIEYGEQERIHVSNGDYQLGGTMRYVSTGYQTRLRGFDNGDGVLVRGVVTPNGVQASEVWGGTREQYLGQWSLYTWVLGVGAAVLALVAVLFLMNS